MENIKVNNDIRSNSLNADNITANNNLTIKNTLIEEKDDSKLYVNNNELVQLSSDSLQNYYPIKVTDNNKIIMENIKVNNDIRSNSLNADNITANNNLTIKNTLLEEKDDSKLYVNNNELVQLPSDSLQSSYPIKVTDNNKIIMENIKVNNDIQSNSLNTDNIITNNNLTIKSTLLEEKDDNQLYINNNNLNNEFNNINTSYPIKVTDDNTVIIDILKTNDGTIKNNLTTGTLNSDTITCNTLITQNINNPSDINIKTNITKIDDENIVKLKPVKFNYKNDENLKFGFIAQEVETVYPNLVSNINGIKHVDYIQLIPLLLNKIIDQESRINYLEELIKTKLV
jgi:hypothetical protein